jgi:peptidoglycan hydrolase-like protein with peptidoglycan-binding domain
LNFFAASINFFANFGEIMMPVQKNCWPFLTKQFERHFSQSTPGEVPQKSFKSGYCSLGTQLFIMLSLFNASPVMSDVLDAQKKLNQLGFNAGPADGVYGRKTESALQRLFKYKGQTYDGHLDANELVELQSLSKLCSPLISEPEPALAVDQHFTTDLFSKPVYSTLPFYQVGTYGSAKSNTGLKDDAFPIITAVGDVNNDNIDDIVVEYTSTAVPPHILTGQQDGVFLNNITVDASAARRGVRQGYLRDINGDQFADYVGFTTSDKISWFEDEGFKNLSPGEPELLLLNQNGSYFQEITLPERFKNDINHGGFISDVNNDGHIDIVSLSEQENKPTYPIINLGDGNFILGEKPFPNLVTQNWIEDGEAADLNNDGIDDFVISIQRPFYRADNEVVQTLSKHKTLLVIMGDSDLDFSNNAFFRVGSYWFNENHLKDEIKYRYPSENTRPNLASVEFGTAKIHITDINDDGLLDIFEAQYINAEYWKTSGFKLYLNRGDCFQDATSAMFPNQRANRFIGVMATAFIDKFYFRDLNSDGLKDLLLKAEFNRDRFTKTYPYIFVQQKSGVFLPAQTSNLADITQLSGSVTGDFNGDGKYDITGILSQRYLVTYLGK